MFGGFLCKEPFLYNKPNQRRNNEIHPCRNQPRQGNVPFKEQGNVPGNWSDPNLPKDSGSAGCTLPLGSCLEEGIDKNSARPTPTSGLGQHWSVQRTWGQQREVVLLEEMMELLFATVHTKCWLGKGQTSGRGGRNTRHWEVPLPWAAEGPALQTNLAKTKVLPFPLIQTWIPCYVFLNLHVCQQIISTSRSDRGDLCPHKVKRLQRTVRSYVGNSEFLRTTDKFNPLHNED